MNPGVGEESAKAIGGVVDSLRAQPLSLALVVMNLALLALFGFFAREGFNSRKTEMEAIFMAQKEVNVALSKCVEPEILWEILKNK